MDLEIPIECTTASKHPGRLRPDEVTVGEVPEHLVEEPLRILQVAETESDTAAGMRDEVFDRAFPRLAEALSHALGDEGMDLASVEAAARQELVDHDESTRFDSVTFSSGMTLCRTTVWTFVRRGLEFEAIAPSLFEDFCYGLATVPPDRDGMVQGVEVTIQLKHGRPLRGDATKGLRLRATQDGRVLPAHRADAFADAGEARESPLQLFERRRNEAVLWTLTAADIAALRRAVQRKARRKILVGVRSVRVEGER